MTPDESATTRKSATDGRRRTGRKRASGAATSRVTARDAHAPGSVHLTAEYWPFARTGGLGEAVNGLANYQSAAGAPTTVVMPLYQQVRETTSDLERVGSAFEVTLGHRAERAWLYRAVSDGGPKVYFIEHPGFFERAGIYGGEAGDFPDNGLRFAFFCMAALAVLPDIAPDAQVLHAHDWHTALAPVYLRTTFAASPWHQRLATVLSVHNAGFQGHFPPTAMADLGLPPHLYHMHAFEWYGRMNVLKGGIAFADSVVTVSPTHARELRSPEGGFGLHDTFTTLGDRLVGILNGIDTKLWDPQTDPQVPATYSCDDLAGKRKCKAELQRSYGLPERARTPVFGMSARLAAQKGFDLILGADLIGSSDAQFVFLGSGEVKYQEALADLAAQAPDRVAVEFAFTDRLEHRLLAGADLLLMPSLYEPCGLTQMRAQRYGAIPVARRVGGLQDSIRDGETGFLFDAYEPAALDQAIREAVDRRHDTAAWHTMVRQAMQERFGWDHAVTRYREVYQRSLAARAALPVHPG